MTEAFHQHLKELIKIFKHIEPNKSKLNAKVRLMLERAYCLQNRANGVPFVPATRGEWNILFFNPDLLKEKFIEHKQQVYVAQQSFIENELIKQNLLELDKRLEKKLILRNENIKRLVKNSQSLGLQPTPESERQEKLGNQNSPSLGLQPRTPESERRQKLRKQLEEDSKKFFNNALENAKTQKLNIVSKKTKKTNNQLKFIPQVINRKLIFENNEDFNLIFEKNEDYDSIMKNNEDYSNLIFENNEDFNLNLKKWTEENDNNLEKQKEALRKNMEKDEKRKGGK